MDRVRALHAVQYQSIDVDGQEPPERTPRAEGRPEGQFAQRHADPNVPSEVRRGFELQGRIHSTCSVTWSMPTI